MPSCVAARRVLTSTRVRGATADDLPHAARLLGTSDETLAAARGELIVATVLGEVTGVAVLEWLHPVQRLQPEAWLTALVTDPTARHRGVARALLEDVMRRVRQAGGLALRVGCAVERDDLRAFFCASGFEARLIVFERAAG